MINRERTGRRIAELRRGMGMTQSALAEKLNVSTQAVSKWECGQSLPDIDTLPEMSWLFGMSVNSILDASELFSSRADDAVYDGFLSALSDRFDSIELVQLDELLRAGELQLELSIKASLHGRSSSASVPLRDAETAHALAPAISQTISGVLDRASVGLRRILSFMRCTDCGSSFGLSQDASGQPMLKCGCGKRHRIIDGVLDFGGHEIPGEQWSLCYRNYQDYLDEKAMPAPDGYGEYAVLLWSEISQRRPRFILDIACGSGIAAGCYIPRIDWPCVVVMADLSHRVLKYDKLYFDSLNNPCVDVVYISCDCARLPFADKCFDVISSLAGFQSMQLKMADGFREARRTLAPDGAVLYTQHLISGTPNSDKWIELMKQDPYFYKTGMDHDMITAADWDKNSREFGLTVTKSFPLTAEWQAPEGDKLPFENQMCQWMASYLMISEKNR